MSSYRTKGQPTKTFDYRDMRASTGISLGDTLFFLASRDTEDLLKNNDNVDAPIIFISRGADLGVNR